MKIFQKTSGPFTDSELKKLQDFQSNIEDEIFSKKLENNPRHGTLWNLKKYSKDHNTTISLQSLIKSRRKSKTKEKRDMLNLTDFFTPTEIVHGIKTSDSRV